MGAVISSVADSIDELHQVQEAAPCHPSSSPLSPQLSYLGPLIRVSDPYNILSPSSSSFPRAPSSLRLQSMSNAASPQGFPGSVPGEHVCTEFHFIRHGESSQNVKPELIGGRTPSATLTGLGERQARALGAHLRSVGMKFDAVYSFRLNRLNGLSKPQFELNMPRDAVELTESVAELCQWQWEGKSRSEIYTGQRAFLSYTARLSRESQRQVEFRVIEFLNNVVIPPASSKARRQRGSSLEHLNKIQLTATQVRLSEETWTSLELKIGKQLSRT